MSGFAFGEMDVREQDPWAYDAVNDLPKSHPLYLPAAGVVNRLAGIYTGVAAGGYETGYTSGFTVPAGKQGFILDLHVSATGPFLVELDIDAAGYLRGWTPTTGGEYRLHPAAPIKLTAGQTCGFVLQNIDTVARSAGVLMQVAYL